MQQTGGGLNLSSLLQKRDAASWAAGDQLVWKVTGRCVGPRRELFVDQVVAPAGEIELTRLTSSRRTAWASMRANGAPRHMWAP